jgi:hypothetical protein
MLNSGMRMWRGILRMRRGGLRIGGGEGVCEYISEQRKGWRGEELGQRDEGVNSKRTKKVKDI